MAKQKVMRGAVIGYGGAFNMGRAHLGFMRDTPGLEPAAACDLDPGRVAIAAQDFPGIQTYTDVGEMLAASDCDLVTVITPHNSHAALAIRCLEAGRHVITEKPMCLTVAEADAMIAAAKKGKRMLTVYHNRRLDGDYMALKGIVAEGLIGEVFHIDVGGLSYAKPGTWWRSDKAISGGGLYDWGAHYIDWVLGLVPQKIDHVVGHHKKLVWRHVTNEDHSHAIIRFADGTVADVVRSAIGAIPRPRWRVLGTKGGVVDTGARAFEVRTQVKGHMATITVPYLDTQYGKYYRNIADHLLRGKELMVKAEEARRVIGVVEAADVSSRKGSQPVKAPHE